MGGNVSGIDDVEYANLAEQVRRIELLVDANTRGDSNYLLKSFLHNAKSRMDELRPDEIRAEDEKKEQKAKETAGIAQLAEMEHKLNAEEKNQYSGFLKLDYFTKANFDELEGFYENSWDKLSESGKTQMSARVWEGIKRKEYTFEDLPETVREKESERMYKQLTGRIESSASLRNVSAQDRADFVREYEAGNEQAASKILSRPAFAEYSPDTRNVSALQADTSTKEKTSGESNDPPNASPQELLAASSFSISGVSGIVEVENTETPKVQAAGNSSIIGKT